MPLREPERLLEQPPRQLQVPSERHIKAVGRLVQSQLVRASSVVARLRLVPLVINTELQALVVRRPQHHSEEALQQLAMGPLVDLPLLRGHSVEQRLPAHSVQPPLLFLVVV